MSQTLKIGYFAHWFRPHYAFVDFLQEQGFDVTKIDYSQPGYLEPFDVVLIEQNGFNDYIENDESYIQDWVSRGGILLFMHQDYKRWAPYFLPHAEVGYTQLIHRHIETINGFSCAADPTFTEDDTPYRIYMMPWIEEPGRRLFSEPEIITPDEMLFWKINVDTFGIIRFTPEQPPCQTVRTAAESCFLAGPEWEILGSYMDPAVRDGALILRAKYGRGMFFLNQILFPEELTPDAERCLSFWRKYVKNLFAYCARFKAGESEELPPRAPAALPEKKNYKMAIHMHALDWYGTDSAPGTINALMRYMNYDICSLGVKDNAPYNGKLDTAKYSDDRVLFLDGQEYHPFNWNDKYDHLSHNTYHMLAMGIDPDAYTPRYTRSFFSDAEIADYLREAVDYVHAHGGAVCATHPNVGYWHDYDFDAVDREPLSPLSGSPIEEYWLSGRRIAMMNSVDLFGARRILDNPAVNFLYLKGEKPCRDSIVRAVREGHTIAAGGFDEADVTLSGFVPGDEVPRETAASGVISIHAETLRGPVRALRVYSGADVIYEAAFEGDSGVLDTEISLVGKAIGGFIRVEIEGLNEHWLCCTTPFWVV
ncbi:MAG: hypothetical protein IKM07_05430 [Clostridia bacterium]|nr:hypothetical protein [Clostridia bacterium]